MESLPESFHAFSPDKPDPTFKYEPRPEGENTPAIMASVKVQAAIKQKCTHEEMMSVLREIADDDSDQSTVLRVSQTQTLMFAPPQNLHGEF